MSGSARTRCLVALGLAAFAAAAAPPAAAHDFWIEPSTFTPPVGSVVAVRLRVGEHFAGSPVMRDPSRIVRFAVVGPDGGEEDVAGLPGWEPAGRLRVIAPGLHAVVYRNKPVAIELPADRFESYLAKEGLEAVSRARAARGARGEPGREIYSRCAKALLDVMPSSSGAAAAGIGDRADRPRGLTLELVADGDPYRLAAGGEMPVRLLYRGEPLSGVRVAAISAADPTAPLAVRTDRDGRVRFRLPRGGRWLITAVHMIAAPAGSGAEWESLWASLTFAVPAE